MSLSVILLCAGVVLCVCLSAFFSGSEIAFSGCSTVRLENERDHGSKRAGTALKIAENYDDALGAILIGNNLVNIAASSMGSVLVITLLGQGYTWISTLVITVTVILFGETIPKITARKAANRVALRYAVPVRVLMTVLRPLIRLVVALVNLITRGMKGEEENRDEQEAVEELQSIIETAEDESVLDEDQSELVQAAIDFNEVSAQEAMTARVDMQALDIDDPEEILRVVTEEDAFSRLPVYEDSIDNIIGVLSVNRVLRALADAAAENGGESAAETVRKELRPMLMPPCYVYKTMKLPAVLERMRRARQHLAVVTDEYGGTLGVISMEDVLEQLVGEIWDETDEVEQEVVEHPDGTYELDGDMNLDDLLELLEIPEDSFEAESETLGGWMLETFGTFPKVGDSFEAFGRRFTVTAMSEDSLRVEKVRTERRPGETGGEPEENELAKK